MQAQDMHPKFSELHSMQRFTEIISNHSIGRTELDCHISFLHLISDKEVSNIDVSGSLPSTGSSICLHFDCTLIVLIDDAISEIVLLALQEPSRPQYLTDHVIHCNKL